MTDAQAISPNVYTWVTRSLRETGAIIREIEVRHVRFSGTAGSPVLTLSELARFDDTADITSMPRKIAKELDDAMREHSRHFAGKVRFELFALSSAGSVVATTIEFKKGEAREDDESGDASQGAWVETLLKHEREMFREAMSGAAEQRRADERRIEKLSSLVEKSYEKYADFLELLEKLADRTLERDLRLAREKRLLIVQDKATSLLLKFAPSLVAKLTRGTSLADEGALVGAAPHLRDLFASLEKDPERAAQVLALLSEGERQNLLFAADALEKEKKDEEVAASDIKVEQPNAPAAPNESAE